eukprot:6180731-Pleurochrysis_carterae.AAC.1
MTSASAAGEKSSSSCATQVFMMLCEARPTKCRQCDATRRKFAVRGRSMRCGASRDANGHRYL